MADSGHLSRQRQDSDEDDSDFDLSDMEDDFDLGGFREKRLEELKQEMMRSAAARESLHGRLTEIREEKDLMTNTASAKTAVVHFFHRDFRRCALMDKHLEKLAQKHFNTLFLKVDVANVPFLVTKFEVKVLPTVMCFVAGVTKDRITGFEGLSINNGDEFTTDELEFRLSLSGCLPKIHTLPKGQAVKRPAF